MPPAPKGLGAKRAIIFHVNDDALLPITETLTSRSIRTTMEQTVRDLKKTMRTEPPEYLIIGAGYLLSRAPTLLFSLTKEFRFIPIILVVTESERDACQSLLGEAVSAYVMEPYRLREIQFALLTADRASSGRILESAVTDYFSDFKNPHKVFIGRSSNAISVRKGVLRAKKHREPVYIEGELGCGKMQISLAIHLAGSNSFAPIRIYDPLLSSRRGRGVVKPIEEIHSTGTVVVRNSQDCTDEDRDYLASLLDSPSLSNASLPRLIIHHDPGRGAPVFDTNQERIETIHIDPLRERREDITLITRYFIESASRVVYRRPASITPQARNLMLDYSWPGNVNELFSIALFALIASEGRDIYPMNLPDFIASRDPYAMEKVSLENLLEAKLVPLIKKMNIDSMQGLYSIVMGRVEAPLIKLVLSETDGNQSKSASILGINRNTLAKKIKQYGIA